MARLCNCVGSCISIVNTFYILKKETTVIIKILKEYIKWLFYKKEEENIPLRDKTYTPSKIGEWCIYIERVK